MDFVGTLIRLKIIPLLKRWNLLYIIIGSLDVLSVFVAYQLSHLLIYHSGALFVYSEKELPFLFLIIMPVWLIVLFFIRLTEIPRTKRYRVLLVEYLFSAIVVFLLQVILLLVLKVESISINFIIFFTGFGYIFLFGVRMLEYKVLRLYRSKGYNYINVVLIANDSSIPLIEKFLATKEWGYNITMIFTSSLNIIERFGSSIKVYPENKLMVLQDILEAEVIDEVMYIKERVNQAEVRRVIRSCEELGVVFRLMNKKSRLVITNAISTIIAGTRFLTFSNIPNNSFALAIKNIIDIYLSAVMIIVFSPFMLIAAILIKLSSRGPVIYKQVRVGLRGRQFNLYKFRTMVANADLLLKDLDLQNEADGPVFKIKEDPRVTAVGKFLRKTGLDELPQLFNILKGEMSIIGPRPPLPIETKQYKRWQLRRLSVRPGLSCFWQVQDNCSVIKFEKWMELDLAYIDNWSLRLDMLIFLKTMRVVIKRSRA